MNNINQLSFNHLLNVFSNLVPSDIPNVSRVCKKWHQVTAHMWAQPIHSNNKKQVLYWDLGLTTQMFLRILTLNYKWLAPSGISRKYLIKPVSVLSLGESIRSRIQGLLKICRFVKSHGFESSEIDYLEPCVDVPKLPSIMWSLIFSHLNPTDFAKIRGVCKSWRTIIDRKWDKCGLGISGMAKLSLIERNYKWVKIQELKDYLVTFKKESTRKNRLEKVMKTCKVIQDGLLNGRWRHSSDFLLERAGCSKPIMKFFRDGNADCAILEQIQDQSIKVDRINETLRRQIDKSASCNPSEELWIEYIFSIFSFYVPFQKLLKGLDLETRLLCYNLMMNNNSLLQPVNPQDFSLLPIATPCYETLIAKRMWKPLQIILNAGYSIDHRKLGDPNTYLMEAILEGKEETVEKLLFFRAKISKLCLDKKLDFTNAGRVPLLLLKHHMDKEKWPEMKLLLECFVSNDANLNIIDPNTHMTFAHYIVRYFPLEFLEIILRSKTLNLNVQSQGRDILELAIEMEDEQKIELIEKYKEKSNPLKRFFDDLVEVAEIENKKQKK